MLDSLTTALKGQIAAAAEATFGVRIDDPVIDVPRDLAHADLASPVAFDLAKRIKAATGEKRAPRDLATVLVEWLQEPDRLPAGIARLDVAGMACSARGDTHALGVDGAHHQIGVGAVECDVGGVPEAWLRAAIHGRVLDAREAGRLQAIA